LFGPHLIIDGSKCDTAKLGDRLLIERLLTDYPRAIGMTRIGGPYMFEYQAPDPAYSGVSGLVVIAESHIAIHTFPALDYFTMDIFSCKNFDHEAAIQYIRNALGVQEMDRMLVQRGLSFRGPHHGPLGATDELIAAAQARHAGMGTTIGSIPVDDPLNPRHQAPGDGAMLWPAYGVTPDLGDVPLVSGGARAGARVTPANAAAAGEAARAGYLPVQPLHLNPTASTSGMLDRLAASGGTGRALGRALALWERLARAEAPVVLALGPHLIAEGMRDVVADLMQRGHVAAVILEGDALLSDAYEALGYRHYLREGAEDAPPVRSAEEWARARAQIAALLAGVASRSGVALARRLGAALGEHAPRPGILTAAAHLGIPVFVTGAAGLGEIGLPEVKPGADRAALRQALAGALLVACGTTAATAQAVAATGASPQILAAGSSHLADAGLTCTLDAALDAALALPLLATGLVQRLPMRARPVTASEMATDERPALMPVG
jgi:S-adenosylmethionine decarboxylase